MQKNYFQEYNQQVLYSSVNGVPNQQETIVVGRTMSYPQQALPDPIVVCLLIAFVNQYLFKNYPKKDWSQLAMI